MSILADARARWREATDAVDDATQRLNEARAKVAQLTDVTHKARLAEDATWDVLQAAYKLEG